MGKRQMSFFIDKDLFKKFSRKCFDLDKKKTPILVELIKKFLGKR